MVFLLMLLLIAVVIGAAVMANRAKNKAIAKSAVAGIEDKDSKSE